MKGLQSFYNSFYGPNFFRHFRAPTDLKNKNIRNPGHQVTVKNARQLSLQIHKRSGTWPCYIHIYNQGTIGNLKRRESVKIVYDRAYFDFDIDHEQIHQLKKQLVNLRKQGLHYQQEKQNELKEKLRKLIINEKRAEPAINQAKEFSIKFQEYFGAYPLLFFSGCKGCHAYTFFNRIKNVDINRALLSFAEKMKETHQYDTMDLSVNKDATARLSRVPYSKHQYSGLTVVPFSIDDSYEAIIEKSLNPVVEPFSREAYYSSFGIYLQRNDKILEHNQKVKETERRASLGGMKMPVKKVADHREWFKSILGEPVYKSPNKPYVMYHCPFPDHEDNTPSFMVYPTGYKCHGCGRKGNYFQFLKDYHNWTDEQVKAHLRTKTNI